MLPLLDKYKGIICDFLDTNPCTSQNILRKLGNIAVSKNTISKYIKLLHYSRKRTQKRGICKNNALPQLIKTFTEKYKSVGITQPAITR